MKPEQEIEPILKIMNFWSKALELQDTSVIQSLYAPEAVLWGTLSAVRRETPESIRDYFDQLKGFIDRKVVFQDPLIRFFGKVAINTGSYTFSWLDGKKKVTIPARYTFSYTFKNNLWLIVDHHSSVVPE